LAKAGAIEVTASEEATRKLRMNMVWILP